MIEPSLDAFIGFPFALVFTCTFLCSLVSRLNFTRESSFKGTPLDWALANVFEELDFRSHNYCEQNKTARGEI